MYLSLLLAGLDVLPLRDATLRQRVDSAPPEQLHQMLAVLAPERAAELHPQDRHRIIRALEVVGLSQTAPSFEAPLRFTGSALVIVPVLPREVLYAKLDERTRQMFSQGILEETKQILARYGVEAPALRAIGYSQALEVIQGTKTLEQGMAEMAQATRNYAKRQMTFFKNEPRKRGWIQDPPQTSQAAGRGEPNHPRDLEGPQIGVTELVGQVASWLRQPAVPDREVWFRVIAPAG